MSNLYDLDSKPSPVGAPSFSNIWADVEGPYLEELLLERMKIYIYGYDLPICDRLLTQEITRISKMLPYRVLDKFDRLQIGSPNVLNPMNRIPDIGPIHVAPLDGNSAWSPIQHQGFGQQGPATGCGTEAPCNPDQIIKKMVRVDVPADRYPDCNFVGRLLGPRGNSLKRIETCTGCRLFIRGRGSIKDPAKEKQVGKRPVNVHAAHLNEPLHVLIVAEAPSHLVDAQLQQAQEIVSDLLKPVSKSKDVHKKQQLRELAMLNASFPENSRASTSQSAHRSGARRHTTTGGR